MVEPDEEEHAKLRRSAVSAATLPSWFRTPLMLPSLGWVGNCNLRHSEGRASERRHSEAPLRSLSEVLSREPSAGAVAVLLVAAMRLQNLGRGPPRAGEAARYGVATGLGSPAQRLLRLGPVVRVASPAREQHQATTQQTAGGTSSPVGTSRPGVLNGAPSGESRARVFRAAFRQRC